MINKIINKDIIAIIEYFIENIILFISSTFSIAKSTTKIISTSLFKITGIK